jgi:hydrogenase maturation protease
VNGVKVIGVGSPHGFDRLGWEVADTLRNRTTAAGWRPGEVSIERCERFGAPLLAQLRTSKRAVIVDALKTGARPGALLRIALTEPGGVPCGLSSHGLGLATTLELGRALGTLPPVITVLGIEADDETAAPTADQVNRLCQALCDELGYGQHQPGMVSCPEPDSEGRPSLYHSVACDRNDHR